MENMEFNNQAQNTKPNNNKTVMLIGIAAAAVVALIVLIALISTVFGGGYKKVIKNSISLVNKKNESSLAYLEFGELKEQYEYSELYAEITDADKDQYEEAIEALEDEFGSNYKIKYKFHKAEKMDKDDLEDLNDELEDDAEDYLDMEDDIMDMLEEMCDEEDISSKDQKKLEKAMKNVFKAYDDIKIKAAYEVTLKCEIKGKDGKEEFKIKDLIVAKINGDWILYQGNINPAVIAELAIEEEED